jgi:ribosomal protein S18 acetylase RimI-like enzyme
MSTDPELWQNPHRRIRWLTRGDLAEVATIDRQSFEHAWSPREFTRELAQRHMMGMVITSNFGRVAGFMLYGLGQSHLVVERLAVLADDRRLGFGSSLLDRLVSRLTGTERTKIVVPVLESNLGGQLFLARCGLTAGAIYVTSTKTRTESWVNFCYARRA